MALNDHLVGPDAVGSDEGLLHLRLHIVDQVVGSFVLI